MKRIFVIAALGIVLAADAAVLIGVASSRSGGPDATLRLSERELVLEVESADNSAVILHPRYVDGAGPFGPRSVLPASKAAELGITARPGQSAAKRAYVALKLQPDAPAGTSRLRVADVGLDPAALRRRYPDRNRYAVARAAVRMGPNREAWVIVLPESIYVPAQRVAVFRHAPAHFSVTLCYSREGDCWVCGAEGQ
jgi:hypothetical protein